MLVCCLRDCPKISEHKELYGLPTHYPSKQSWLANIRDKIDVSCVESNKSQLLICHLHFKPEDFIYTFNDYTFTKQLNEKACPSVFPQDSIGWQANYIAHQQLNQANSTTSNNTSGSAEQNVTQVDNIVELGNVESLGILPEVWLKSIRIVNKVSN